MKIFVAAILILCSITLAFAASGVIDTTLSLDQIVALQKAITSLDQPYQDFGQNGQAVQKRYRFSITARLIFARDLKALAPIKAAAEAKRDEFYSNLVGTDAKVDTNSPAFAKFTLATNALGRQKFPVELNTLSQADLNLDANPIPASDLSTLMLIIEDNGSAPADDQSPLHSSGDDK